ncbi:MAG TPA: CRTAC1 family protein [Planctomycetaceae bacterium]|nr:CRTAC1 family protein [Planctomycetaceae bacterium]
MPRRDPSLTRRWLIGGGLFAALIAAVVAGLLLRPPDRRAGPSTKLDRETSGRMVTLRNVAIAQLENAAYAEAIETLNDLVEALPDEPLGFTNRVIARLLPAELEADAERRQSLLDDAAADLERLMSLAGEAPVTHRLVARLAELQNDRAAAFDALARAADLAPDHASYHYELFVAGESLPPDDERREAARAALRRAYALAPDNLLVLFALLRMQAETRDPAVRVTLAAARKTLRPFAEQYRSYGVELDATIDAALAAIDQREAGLGAWRTATLLSLQNLTIPEMAWGLDGRRIDRHLLEFVVHDFSARFYERADLPRERSSEPVPVRFVAAPENAQPADLSGVTALKLADFDLDGRLDLLVLREDRLEAHARPDPDAPWQIIASTELPRPMHGIIAIDMDRDEKENPDLQQFDVINETPLRACVDADVDLITFGAGGLLVFKNVLDRESGRRSLELMPQDEAFDGLRDVLTAQPADLDQDGDLDLVVSSASGLSLWSNRDNFTFEDISGRSALPPESLRAATLLPVDWDRTVTLDVILGGTAAGILENILHGRLRWREFSRDFELFVGARSLEVVDADGSGSWDLIAGGANGIVLASTRTPVPGVVRLDQITRISEEPVLGLTAADYDNDGSLDLIAWTAERIDVYRGQPDGRFVRQEGLVEDPPSPIIAVHAGDIDRDGDIDLVVHTPDRVLWLSNEGGNANHWIDLAIRADPEKTPQKRNQRCNMHGLGSLLDLRAGPLVQRRVVREQRTHFGLGRRECADAVRVLWTNGIPQQVLQPCKNETICQQQYLSGSCPYLYTWTGSGYEFFTDCLWAAPLGLQLAEGVVAPMREWEYLLIPGERLVAVEGEYRLQITEELWEAGYFDRVQLIAIDHPADVDVYSNEKVGPAEIAEFKVHTVRQPRLPVAARDQRGRDVLDGLRAQDGVFVRSFDRWFKQGLTEEHFLELDLGPLDDPERITLFLTGWIFPTDSSLNVAISQNPELESPQPPSLWVPDANGQWQNVVPYMGFPGGKTKTIAVDLSDVFLTDDYRVRIATTMEICWDNAFFTVDEAPAEYRLTHIAPAAADLHDRGFSARIEHDGDGPETYDYADVSTEPRWPPMFGRFTRYGDVTELLQAEDDRLVVLAPGDELTVRFRVPDEPPPPGWKRDFFLYNVGWDKDANLNTITGQTVEPLPFRAMKRYPPGLDEMPPDSPEYRDYLRTYQTREQNPAAFWRPLDARPPTHPEDPS